MTVAIYTVTECSAILLLQYSDVLFQSLMLLLLSITNCTCLFLLQVDFLLDMVLVII